MPHRIDLFISVLSSVLMTTFNIVILITWYSALAFVPLVLSTLWWVAKIKRDVFRFHKGSYKSYIRYILSYVKKNKN